MKQIKSIILPVIMFMMGVGMLVSCQKSSSEETIEKKGKNFFQIYAIGADTTKTNIIVVNTAGPHESENEDPYLKLNLLTYDYSTGEYLLEVTNKQSCQADIELHYDGVSITAITPNKKNNLEHIWVAANTTELFRLKGSPKIGKIKAKALTICNWQGKNPKWVQVDITNITLPIKYTEVTSSKIGNNKVRIEFSIDDPGIIDYFEVWQSKDSKYYILTKSIKCDKGVKKYSIELDKI